MTDTENKLSEQKEKVKSMTRQERAELKREILAAIAEIDTRKVEEDVEQFGFCVTQYGVTSKYKKVTTYLGATWDGTTVGLSSTAKSVPWALTLGYDVGSFDFSSHKRSDIQIEWTRREIPFILSKTYCRGPTIRVNIHFKEKEMPGEGWHGLLLFNEDDHFRNVYVLDGTLYLNKWPVTDTWRDNGMLIDDPLSKEKTGPVATPDLLEEGVPSPETRKRKTPT
jgi:hypothetical protein